MKIRNFITFVHVTIQHKRLLWCCAVKWLTCLWHQTFSVLQVSWWIPVKTGWHSEVDEIQQDILDRHDVVSSTEHIYITCTFMSKTEQAFHHCSIVLINIITLLTVMSHLYKKDASGCMIFTALDKKRYSLPYTSFNQWQCKNEVFCNHNEIWCEILYNKSFTLQYIPYKGINCLCTNQTLVTVAIYNMHPDSF